MSTTANEGAMPKLTPPRIFYGSAWKKDRTAELVEEAISCGFRGIDTACQPKHYNESGVGEVLRRLPHIGIRRESLFIQTKFTPVSGQDHSSIPYNANLPLNLQVKESVAASLRNLSTDYVDSLMLHSPLPTFDQQMEVWGAMEEVHCEKRALRLGVCHCYQVAMLERLYRETNIKPAVVQNRFYKTSGYDKDVRKWCKENGVEYQGFWIISANAHLLSSDVVGDIAKRKELSKEQVLFGFLSRLGIVLLTGTTSTQHMMESLNSIGLDLSGAEMSRMHSLLD